MNGNPVSPNAPSAAPERRWLRVGLYTLIAFLYWMSLYLYMPTLPTYAQGKVSSLALVGVILAQYGLWQAIVRLPVGIASDWVGKRKVFMMAGFVLAGVGAWTMGRAAGAPGLMAGRAITGLAAAAWVPLTVAFSGLFPPQEAVRAAALLSAAANGGRIVATSATGALNGLGGYSLTFNMAAAVALLSALALLAVPEVRLKARVPSLRSLGDIATRRDVLVPSLLQAVAQYASWAAPFGFVSILARQMGASDTMQSLLMSLNIAMVTVGGLVTAVVAPRFGGRRMAYVSFAGLATGMGLAALSPTLGVLSVAQALMGLAMGVGYPVLMGLSIERVGEAQRATAMGLHQAVYAVGMFAGPSLSGVLAEATGIRPMFGMTAVGCLALALVLLRLLRSGAPVPDKGQS